MDGFVYAPWIDYPCSLHGYNVMNYDNLIESVKKHEGFRDTPYLDTLNKRTVGFGHLCVEDHWEDGKKYDKKYLEDILEKDLQYAINQGEGMCQDLKISDDAKFLIIEMIFQLGSSGVQKFRKMWDALKEDPPNYFEAHVQMLDSRWAKQTPNRAGEMAESMQSCG
jgi:lysozyme